MLEQLVKDYIPWETPCWNREREQGGRSGRDELATTAMSHVPCPCIGQGGDVEESGVFLSYLDP